MKFLGILVHKLPLHQYLSKRSEKSKLSNHVRIWTWNHGYSRNRDEIISNEQSRILKKESEGRNARRNKINPRLDNLLAWGTLSTQGIVILSGVVCCCRRCCRRCCWRCCWCHKSCPHPKFENRRRYRLTFFY